MPPGESRAESEPNGKQPPSGSSFWSEDSAELQAAWQAPEPLTPAARSIGSVRAPRSPKPSARGRARSYRKGRLGAQRGLGAQGHLRARAREGRRRLGLLALVSAVLACAAIGLTESHPRTGARPEAAALRSASAEPWHRTAGAETVAVVRAARGSIRDAARGRATRRTAARHRASSAGAAPVTNRPAQVAVAPGRTSSQSEPVSTEVAVSSAPANTTPAPVPYEAAPSPTANTGEATSAASSTGSPGPTGKVSLIGAGTSPSG
jgi:hypothetical protein